MIRFSLNFLSKNTAWKNIYWVVGGGCYATCCSGNREASQQSDTGPKGQSPAADPITYQLYDLTLAKPPFFLYTTWIITVPTL